jgi:small subunit ribosomal protein S2
VRLGRGDAGVPLLWEDFVSQELVKKLVESGVHFGHRASRWNPKMRPYIYGRRNLIHIIDVRETLRGLFRAKKYLSQVAAGGSLVLFVGTKRQASDSVSASDGWAEH